MLFSIYSIGFLLSSEESLNTYISRALHRGERIATPVGTYVRWAARCGSELWVKLDPDGGVLGINPFFEGYSTIRLGIMERVVGQSRSPLDGSFGATAHPRQEGDLITGDFHFTFHTPNFAMYRDLELPSIQQAQLSGIARELMGFEDEGHYRQWQAGMGREQPVEYFYTPPDPDEWMTFSGRIKDAALLTNDLTGHPFYWAWVQIPGGEIDVVTHPDNLRGELVPGGVCAGSIWLTGKILESEL